MKSFCIIGAVFLLSAVELEAATPVPEFLCSQRNLSVTVDNFMKIYIDGVNITDLPYADDFTQPDVVELPCNTILIAIHGRNGNRSLYAAILASTGDDYVLTNSSWKCSNVSQSGWEEIDFDDSTWMNAIEYAYNGEDPWRFIPGISPNASWIWLRQYNGLLNSTYEEMDEEVYCRKRLDINYCESSPCLNGGTCESVMNNYLCQCQPGYTGDNCEYALTACDPNPCLNGGTCNYAGEDSFTCTCPIYLTGVKCESPNYNEAFTCGTTLTWSQYNASNGFTRLCYSWVPMEDTEERFKPCRYTINGLPLYDDHIGLLNAGGNFGCVVSQNYPEDLPATSYLSCADNYQQDVFVGNYSESDRLMVCIRYPYEGIPGTK